MTDQVGTTQFTWPAPGLGAPNGQIASETTPWSGDAVTSGYSQGLRTSLFINNPSIQQSMSYDAAWRMTNLVSSLAGTFAYAYDAQRSTLLTKISLPSWASITNHYASLARLDYTALKNYWSHVLDGYAYKSDPLGLRTNIVRDFGLTTNSLPIAYDIITH